eukprot:CAMPEP_0172519850 /NCGR_PEP_ID=MMETSP1066-20121228/291660_1 /TAXON_ID=671091 /ORGANISM="Coscinodiscus wailesii, Strain CCMP2513" /LENGTH=562 /DNA_ID=CAMNT_0013302513 /DNA_START=332 /DNA_END=2019 /DNA_ORIENTATION=-
MIGVGVGYRLPRKSKIKRLRSGGGTLANDDDATTTTTPIDDGPVPSSNSPLSVTSSLTSSSSSQPDDDTRQILSGALSLLLQKRQTPTPPSQKQTGAVVNYLSPRSLLATLFSPTSPRYRTLSLSSSSSSSSPPTPSQFLHLLQQLQHYSVDTSHPYFFNQLFGACDDVALAAEIIALSVNTSAYTFETAPVFTLLEREVVKEMCKLVFGNGSTGGDDDGRALTAADERDDDEKEDGRGEGLFTPGGSFSNLMAMNVARYAHRERRRQQQRQPHCADTADDERASPDSNNLTSNTRLAFKKLDDERASPTPLVALVTEESHYSFLKASRVLDVRLVTVPVVPRTGVIDVNALERVLSEEGDGVFFIGLTSGSTVRGSFDPVRNVINAARRFDRSRRRHGDVNDGNDKQRRKRRNHIWIHVDGAWGGSAIFSPLQRKTLLDGIDLADSFTFNPHKMLGCPQQTSLFLTRHTGVLSRCHSTKAPYLFSPLKNGASFDLGDDALTCGRRTDCVKLWAIMKYYGCGGLGQLVESKVNILGRFVEVLRRRRDFVLACPPWPFNVNFY